MLNRNYHRDQIRGSKLILKSLEDISIHEGKSLTLVAEKLGSLYKEKEDVLKRRLLGSLGNENLENEIVDIMYQRSEFRNLMIWLLLEHCIRKYNFENKTGYKINDFGTLCVVGGSGTGFVNSFSDFDGLFIMKKNLGEKEQEIFNSMFFKLKSLFSYTNIESIDIKISSVDDLEILGKEINAFYEISKLFEDIVKKGIGVENLSYIISRLENILLDSGITNNIEGDKDENEIITKCILQLLEFNGIILYDNNSLRQIILGSNLSGENSLDNKINKILNNIDDNFINELNEKYQIQISKDSFKRIIIRNIEQLKQSVEKNIKGEGQDKLILKPEHKRSFIQVISVLNKLKKKNTELIEGQTDGFDEINKNNIINELGLACKLFSSQFNELLSLKNITLEKESFDEFNKKLREIFINYGSQIVKIIKITHHYSISYIPQNFQLKDSTGFSVNKISIKRAHESSLWPVMIHMIIQSNTPLLGLNTIDSIRWLRENGHIREMTSVRLEQSIISLYLLRELAYFQYTETKRKDIIDQGFYDFYDSKLKTENPFIPPASYISDIAILNTRNPLFLLDGIPNFFETENEGLLNKEIYKGVYIIDNKLSYPKPKGMNETQYLINIFELISRCDLDADYKTKQHIQACIERELPHCLTSISPINKNQFQTREMTQDILHHQKISRIRENILAKCIYEKGFSKAALYLSRYGIMRQIFPSYGPIHSIRQTNEHYFEAGNELLYRLKIMDDLRRSNNSFKHLLRDADKRILRLAIIYQDFGLLDKKEPHEKLSTKYFNGFVQIVNGNKNATNINKQEVDSVRFLIENHEILFSEEGLNLSMTSNDNTIILDRFAKLVEGKDYLVDSLLVISLIGQNAINPFSPNNEKNIENILKLNTMYRYLKYTEVLVKKHEFWRDFTQKLSQKLKISFEETKTYLENYRNSTYIKHIILSSISKSEENRKTPFQLWSEIEKESRIIENIDFTDIIYGYNLLKTNSEKNSLGIIKGNESLEICSTIYVRFSSRCSLKRFTTYLASINLSINEVIFFPSSENILSCKFIIGTNSFYKVDNYKLKELLDEFSLNENKEEAIRDQIVFDKIQKINFPIVEGEIFCDVNLEKKSLEIRGKDTPGIYLRLMILFDKLGLGIKSTITKVNNGMFHNIFYFDGDITDSLNTEVIQILQNEFKIN